MNVVILAAGMGKRMQSALPKVLHPLAGKPLLRHVIDTARGLNPQKLCVIYGHGGAAVPEMVATVAESTGSTIDTALQEPQQGTGHAVMQAVPQLDDDQPTIVLYGDVPLTTVATLRRLVEAAGSDKLGILTVEQANPFGLGRIVREDGKIVRIVEEKDATEAERAIAHAKIFHIFNFLRTAYERCDPRRRYGQTHAVRLAESTASIGW